MVISQFVKIHLREEKKIGEINLSAFYLPINSPFLATLQTTDAGVIIAGKVFERSKGGIIFRELLPVPVCAARAAAAALKSNKQNL